MFGIFRLNVFRCSVIRRSLIWRSVIRRPVFQHSVIRHSVIWRPVFWRPVGESARQPPEDRRQPAGGQAPAPAEMILYSDLGKTEKSTWK